MATDLRGHQTEIHAWPSPVPLQNQLMVPILRRPAETSPFVSRLFPPLQTLRFVHHFSCCSPSLFKETVILSVKSPESRKLSRWEESPHKCFNFEKEALALEKTAKAVECFGTLRCSSSCRSLKSPQTLLPKLTARVCTASLACTCTLI